jgi:hypothetical protein
MNFIYNMGAIFYIYCLVIILTLIAVIFTLSFNYISCCRNKKILKQIKDYCWIKITPGLYLRLFIETNFELLIASFLQFNVKENSSSSIDYFSKVLAGIGACACIGIPILSMLKIV